ncbi:MAG: DUF4338 domain-containing protein [Actinomycetota bacterium]|nr:DUF4338 domain-containing protein [Actinomycetota bacterium]
MSAPARYCGRELTAGELARIGELVASLPIRRAIADALCGALSWRRFNGRRKDMSARVALLRMERDGLICLPPARDANGNGKIARYQTPPQLLLPLVTPASLKALGDVELVVVSTKAAFRRWRELSSSYHCLGYTPFAGAQLPYLIESSSGTLGALCFAASAWSRAPRDAHIGWDAPTRKARLHLVVGNARSLILPEVRVKNLASHVLSRVARWLASDWQTAYGYAPVLAETFVETGRSTGAGYKAANWIWVGQTKGPGKLDRTNSMRSP